MHFLFLTIPSAGEFNVQLATAQELLNVGHKVTFLSGASFHKHIEKFRRQQSSEKKAPLINFVSLGSQKSVEDFTPVVQERIHEMRRPPGDLTSINTCIEIAMVGCEEHMNTAFLVRHAIEDLDPDMIAVDVLSPAMITGVRLTQRRFVLTIPCSPGMTALPSYFEPHCVAGNREGSWTTLLENALLRSRQLYYFATRMDMREKRSLLTQQLGLTSFGLKEDLGLLPPYWDDPNCVGGVHFNTFALTDCLQQPASVVFVGAGVCEEPSCQNHSEESLWLDEALQADEGVVYLNMGSMFIWTQKEFEACIDALQDVYDAKRGAIRFLLKLNKPIESFQRFKPDRPLPHYIRVTNWIDCQQSVYRHAALKVFVHHGGGNSFNEAVYFGVPQLILSQWLDTHEYGALADRFGIGLRSSRPPHIDAVDIREKLLHLLGPEWAKFKARASVWSLRSKLGGGPAAAARILEVHAENYEKESDRTPSHEMEQSNRTDMASIAV